MGRTYSSGRPAMSQNLSAYEPNKLNHRHQAMAEWLVANPDATLTDLAKDMNYSLPWVSRIVGSDMFQALYQNLCEERQVITVHSIGTKIAAAGHLAMDRLVERLAGKPSDRLLMQATDSILDKMGYGSKNVTVNSSGDTYVGLTPEDLERAKVKARALNAGEIVDVESEVVN